MERLIVICSAALFSTLFYYVFSLMLRKPAMCGFVKAHRWLLHPNSICYWRAAMALVALVMYFWLDLQSLAIFVFTFAAILDGVDGMVARRCVMISRLGEWLDPLCDKLTYLPPLLAFSYGGILSVKLMWIFIGIELFGQFFARKVLAVLKISGAANNFGKIKAIICFALVIFCALLEGMEGIIDIGDEMLLACIILAAASILFKFIPSWLYADICSTLNLFCGLGSLYFTHEGQVVKAIIIIIIGQLFDLFDGRLAEKHGGTAMGPYLDDLADFVSFGLAPAYVMVETGSNFALLFGVAYVAGVAFRLIRFVAVDKKREDLPEGVFNGLPSPAGALIVLGAALIVAPQYLWFVVVVSTLLMVSTIRFAHFGRIVLKKMPRPIFYTMNAFIILVMTYIFKTKSAEIFGYTILASVILYMICCRKFVKD